MAQRLLFAAVFGALGAVAEAGSPAGASILSAMEVNEMSVGNAALQRDDVGVRAVASRRAMKPIMLVSIMAVSLAAIYLILQCMRVISGGNSNGASLRRLAGKESEDDDACTKEGKPEQKPKKSKKPKTYEGKGKTWDMAGGVLPVSLDAEGKPKQILIQWGKQSGPQLLGPSGRHIAPLVLASGGMKGAYGQDIDYLLGQDAKWKPEEEKEEDVKGIEEELAEEPESEEEGKVAFRAGKGGKGKKGKGKKAQKKDDEDGATHKAWELTEEEQKQSEKEYQEYLQAQKERHDRGEYTSDEGDEGAEPIKPAQPPAGHPAIIVMGGVPYQFQDGKALGVAMKLENGSFFVLDPNDDPIGEVFPRGKGMKGFVGKDGKGLRTVLGIFAEGEGPDYEPVDTPDEVGEVVEKLVELTQKTEEEVQQEQEREKAKKKAQQKKKEDEDDDEGHSKVEWRSGQ